MGLPKMGKNSVLSEPVKARARQPTATGRHASEASLACRGSRGETRAGHANRSGAAPLATPERLRWPQRQDAERQGSLDVVLWRRSPLAMKEQEFDRRCNQPGHAAPRVGMLVALAVPWGGSFFFVGVAVKEFPTCTVVACRVGLAARPLPDRGDTAIGEDRRTRPGHLTHDGVPAPLPASSAGVSVTGRQKSGRRREFARGHSRCRDDRLVPAPSRSRNQGATPTPAP